MHEKLLAMAEHFEEINRRLSDPDVISDRDAYAALMKEHKNLAPIIEVFREYQNAQAEQEEAKALLGEGDAELREMAQLQLEEARDAMAAHEQQLRLLLLPKDPVRRHPSLPIPSTGCIRCMPKHTTGNRRC